jgi:hypothetical protein
MSEIPEELAKVREQIALACAKSSRSIATVQLIAVSKTVPSERLRDALEEGQSHFGESKLQEAEGKIADLPSSICWHFIGRVQRNKVRKLLPLFDVFHAIDSLKLATYTNEVAKDLGLFPKVFLQINVGAEESKGGFTFDELRAGMDRILALERLEILGLMCIPPEVPDPEQARPWFALLRQERDALEKSFQTTLPFLSMGMSGDYEVAIEEGATHVRVGSAIFGKRSYRVDGELG